MINPNPITAVTEADIGRTVSYAVVGHSESQQAVIDGLSYIDGKTFIRFPEGGGLLVDLHDLQWGVQPLWWDEAERQRKVREIQEKAAARRAAAKEAQQ